MIINVSLREGDERETKAERGIMKETKNVAYISLCVKRGELFGSVSGSGICRSFRHKFRRNLSVKIWVARWQILLEECGPCALFAGYRTRNRRLNSRRTGHIVAACRPRRPGRLNICFRARVSRAETVAPCKLSLIVLPAVGRAPRGSSAKMLRNSRGYHYYLASPWATPCASLSSAAFCHPNSEKILALARVSGRLAKSCRWIIQDDITTTYTLSILEPRISIPPRRQRRRRFIVGRCAHGRNSSDSRDPEKEKWYLNRRKGWILAGISLFFYMLIF